MFRESAVSLSWCADARGGWEWQVVKERGAIPQSCGVEGCRACGFSGWEQGELRRAYTVVKVHGACGRHAVAIGLLSRQTVGVVGGRLGAELLSLYRVGGADFGAGRARLFGLLNAGLYSLQEGCMCSVRSGVCATCATVEPKRRGWAWRDCFDGAFPLGGNHWFTGVTEAAGCVGAAGLPWLMCWEGVF